MIRDRDSLASTAAHEIALASLEAGIEAAHPKSVLERTITLKDGILTINGTQYNLADYDEVVLLGGGNAAGEAATVLEKLLGEDLTRGVVVTDGAADTSKIRVIEGDHPIPTTKNIEGTREVITSAEKSKESTLVLAFIGGGGSALLSAPTEPLTLEEIRATTAELLASGASIHEINTVRKHLSQIKGGRLAKIASPATVVGLVFSDVVGDDLSIIASGPLSPDRTTYDDARKIASRYRLDVPDPVQSHLQQGVRGKLPETPTSDDNVFENVFMHVLADGMTTLLAARATAVDQGFDSYILSSRIRGEAREAAKTHVGIAEEIHNTGNPFLPPAVLVSGGETTVTITGDGKGGPNQEFALASSLELDIEDIVVASVDTDGIDGASDAAGAIVDSETTANAENDGHNALQNNDAYTFLEKSNSLIKTGPTGTNVNDLRIIVIDD
ncbi:glycerate kinase type-2 family protein [Haloarcula marina]|uniref:glycerate kinase type-2 family protein n=1 Tax=Haloarcula marina TaxID=2961574 RepID=UPI0020B7D12B|nr:glycerate kinase [Halomicroarcula marina]